MVRKTGCQFVNDCFRYYGQICDSVCMFQILWPDLWLCLHVSDTLARTVTLSACFRYFGQICDSVCMFQILWSDLWLSDLCFRYFGQNCDLVTYLSDTLARTVTRWLMFQILWPEMWLCLHVSDTLARTVTRWLMFQILWPELWLGDLCFKYYGQNCDSVTYVSDTLARTVTLSATPTVPVGFATVPVTVPTSVTSVSMAICARINAVRLVLWNFIIVRQWRITYSENGMVNSKMQMFLSLNWNKKQRIRFT